MLIEVKTDTVRTWLDGYRFNKFKVFIGAYKFNKEFLDIFCDFLWLKKKEKYIKIVQNYYKKNSCK
jgi:hypothetical protein